MGRVVDCIIRTMVPKSNKNKYISRYILLKLYISMYSKTTTKKNK